MASSHRGNVDNEDDSDNDARITLSLSCLDTDVSDNNLDNLRVIPWQRGTAMTPHLSDFNETRLKYSFAFSWKVFGDIFGKKVILGPFGAIWLFSISP